MKKENNNKSDSEEDLPEKISYAYWKRDGDKVDPNAFKPQKSNEVFSSSSESKIETSSGSQIKPTQGSAWNNAQTWEEKHLTKDQVIDFFNKELDKEKCILGESFLMEKVSDYKGDVRNFKDFIT
jgi:hypothetical protein